VLAAGQEDEDPADAYEVDLLLGERRVGPDREMALSFVRSASAINRMTNIAFFMHYGETSRIVGFFQEPSDNVAERIFALYTRHAAAVCRVFDRAITANASKLREGSLHAESLLSLIVGQRGEEGGYRPPSSAPEQTVSAPSEIRMAVDEHGKHVVFDDWGKIRGVGAELIIALAQPFRQAMRDELAPEHYPFTSTATLQGKVNCQNQESLRRRVLRCRNEIEKLAKNAGAPSPMPDAVIENLQWHGYRLNPDRIRIVAISELSCGQ
jgi:hypothetical protein